jgi:riboflavin synthase
MFTGLVQDRGRVEAVDTTADGVRLRMRSALASELGEGDSVAVEGVCLTATAVDRAGFAADVMSETLRRSTLGDLRAGSSANLELPGPATASAGMSFKAMWTESQRSAT